jgi:hypothetical protein
MGTVESPWVQDAALAGGGKRSCGTRSGLALPTHRARPLGSRWTAWARAIAARYAAQAAWRRPVRMWLARPAIPPTGLRKAIRELSITLAPRIRLGLVTLDRTRVGDRGRWRTPTVANTSRGGRSRALHFEPSPTILNRTLAGEREVRWTALPAAGLQSGRGGAPRVEPGLVALNRAPAGETQARWNLAPTIGLPLRRSATQPVSPVIQRLAGDRARARLLALRAREAVQAGMLGRRLLARGERVEVFGRPGVGHGRLPGTPAARHGESGQQAGEHLAWPKPAPRPPAMVFRRPGVAPKDPATSAWEGAPGLEPYPAPPLAHNTRAPGPPQALAMDVNRLTDQVITTLDQRLAAWRERMGRM